MCIPNNWLCHGGYGYGDRNEIFNLQIIVNMGTLPYSLSDSIREAPKEVLNIYSQTCL